MSDNPLEGFKFYNYTPSAAAALIFACAFGFSTIMHTFQMFRTRTWFVIPFICGAILSTIGYIARFMSSREAPDYTLMPYIQQSLTLLVAPALFAGSIYMILKRIIGVIQAEHHSPVRMRWLTKLFVAGDILSFFAQGGGGGLLASKSVDMMKTGERLIVVGLFIQLAFFALFVFTSVLVHMRVNDSPTAVSELPELPWRKHLYCLYLMSVLIFIRSVFRVIEYLQGHQGYLLKREAYLYVFDATLMLLVCIALHIIHPSEVDALQHGGMVSRAGGFKYEFVPPVYSQAARGDSEMSRMIFDRRTGFAARV